MLTPPPPPDPLVVDVPPVYCVPEVLGPDPTPAPPAVGPPSPALFNDAELI
jgi:hypothetical protein